MKKSCINRNKDEYYTPAILVEPILEYAKGKTVWCPFDTEKSEFVRLLKANGSEVIWSHLADGKDFFQYEPEEEYDCIISNPPFSRKIEVFERLYDLGKPFAMLMNIECLNYQVVGNMFYNHDSDLQLLIVDKKVSFDGKTAMFNSSYFCKDMLPQPLVFKHLEHNNSGKHFCPSTMYQDKKYIERAIASTEQAVA